MLHLLGRYQALGAARSRTFSHGGFVWGREMASEAKENLSCPVCLDIFKDPVLLACSHSICRDCVKQCWKQKPRKECPVCKTRCRHKDLPQNLALRRLCESFTSAEASGQLCSLHSEKLSLFCLDDEEPMCVVCLHTEKHDKHRFRPIHEAAEDHRRLLEESLRMLREQLQELQDSHDRNENSYGDTLLKAQHAEGQMKKVFESLRRLLRKEEEARTAAVAEEVEQQGREVSEKQVDLSKDIDSLSDAIKDTEEKLQAEDIAFLHNYKTVSGKVQSLMLGYPEPSPKVEFDESKHLAELPFNILERMKAKISYTMMTMELLSLCGDDAECITINGAEDYSPETSEER